MYILYNSHSHQLKTILRRSLSVSCILYYNAKVRQKFYLQIKFFEISDNTTNIYGESVVERELLRWVLLYDRAPA